MTASREDWPYAGLPGVVRRGVTVYRCPSCGEFEVEISRVTEPGNFAHWAKRGAAPSCPFARIAG